MKTVNKTLIVASLVLTLTFALNLEDAQARGHSGGGSRGGSHRGGSRGGFHRGGSRGGSRGGFHRGGFHRGGSNGGGFHRGGSQGGSHVGGGHHNGGSQSGGHHNGGSHNGGSHNGGHHGGGMNNGGHHNGGHHNGGHHQGGQNHSGHHNGHWNHGGHQHHNGSGFGKWHGGHYAHHHGHHHHGWGFGRHYHRGWGFGFFNSFVSVGPSYSYCNPYCVPGAVSVYDYSQPLGPAGDDQQLSEIASNYFAQAREAFYAGDLKTAMEKIELAIKEAPSNSDLHQFRSLVLFSMKEFRQAAAAAHVALTAGPGWNWDTLKSLYPSTEIYTAGLRALEQTRDQNKQDPAIRFLLAYHYLMLNHVESAAKELTQVVALEPRDELAVKMLKAITGQDVETEQPAQYEQPAEQLQTNVESDAAGLGALGNASGTGPASTEKVQQPKMAKSPEPKEFVGEFKANPAEEVELRLVLNADKTFVWSFKSKEETSSFEGTYTITGNELTLVRQKDGDKLVGIMTAIEKGFNFKMQDGDPQDPGLNFTK